MLKGYRKAYASLGDDPRARFVRVDHDAAAPRKRRVTKARLPGFEAAFIQEGRTKFSKSVKAPNKDILVSGFNNIKIGKIVRKGKLRGYRIYTLSLEERKTCPSSCSHWQSCYGNNMPFAKRVDHTHPDFYNILATAIHATAIHAKCCAAQDKGTGVLIRLHALGDFFSVEYVNFWRDMLRKYQMLYVYGYTAQEAGTAIGDGVDDLHEDFGPRAMLRRSNGGYYEMNTASIGSVESCPPGAFVCPEQTGKTLGCDTCGLCWGTKKNVAFLEH